MVETIRLKLVVGFNPFEKYESNWKPSPSKGENKKHVKPPTGKDLPVQMGGFSGLK